MKKITLSLVILILVCFILSGCSTATKEVPANHSSYPAISYNDAGSMGTQQYEEKQNKFRGRTAGGNSANKRSINYNR